MSDDDNSKHVETNVDKNDNAAADNDKVHATVAKSKEDAARERLEDLPLPPCDDYAPPVPPDGGWGWAVVAASFICNLIVDGVCYTFGIFLGELVDYFEASKGKTALAGSMVPGMYLMAGEFSL